MSAAAPARPQRGVRVRSAALLAAREVAHRAVLRPFVAAVVRVRVRGAENLRGVRGPVIVVANHSSHLDAPVLFAGLPRRTTRTLATAAAADYFFASRWRAWPTVLWFNAIPVHRDGARTHSGLSRAALERGDSLLVFPEGGRARDEVHKPFKPGAASLAISCGVPCVPVAVVGARQAMPRGARWPALGRPLVELVIGEPVVALPGADAEVFAASLADAVQHLSDTTDRPLRMSPPPTPGPTAAPTPQETPWTTSASSPPAPGQERAPSST